MKNLKLTSTLNFSLCTFNLQKGQTLVTLLFFMVIATTITSAAVAAIITNSLSTSKVQEGNNAYFVAESGIENALIRLLRDSSYSGETLSVGLGTATVQVSPGPGTYIITSTAVLGNYNRKIQAVASGSATLAITSWKEIY